MCIYCGYGTYGYSPYQQYGYGYGAQQFGYGYGQQYGYGYGLPVGYGYSYPSAPATYPVVLAPARGEYRVGNCLCICQ